MVGCRRHNTSLTNATPRLQGCPSSRTMGGGTTSNGERREPARAGGICIVIKTILSNRGAPRPPAAAALPAESHRRQGGHYKEQEGEKRGSERRKKHFVCVRTVQAGGEQHCWRDTCLAKEGCSLLAATNRIQHQHATACGRASPWGQRTGFRSRTTAPAVTPLMHAGTRLVNR